VPTPLRGILGISTAWLVIKAAAIVALALISVVSIASFYLNAVIRPSVARSRLAPKAASVVGIRRQEAVRLVRTE
jgi:hypothetical protein